MSAIPGNYASEEAVLCSIMLNYVMGFTFDPRAGPSHLL